MKISISEIIAQTKNMKGFYAMSFFINVVIYFFIIKHLIVNNIFYWQFYPLLLIGFISTVSLTYKVIECFKKLTYIENILLSIIFLLISTIFFQHSSYKKQYSVYKDEYTSCIAENIKLRKQLNELQNDINTISNKLTVIEAVIKIKGQANTTGK